MYHVFLVGASEICKETVKPTEWKHGPYHNLEIDTASMAGVMEVTIVLTPVSTNLGDKATT